MNALQDLSKKTSINSLLNPQEASAFPASVGANPGHHDNQGVIYTTSFSNGSSFHLRAASWDSVNEAKRKAENGANGHHHLHPHQHISSAEAYSGDRAPRMSRSRMGDIQPFPIEGPVWQPQQDVSNMSYGASIVPPLYSAERTRKPPSMYSFTFLTLVCFDLSDRRRLPEPWLVILFSLCWRPTNHQKIPLQRQLQSELS